MSSGYARRSRQDAKTKVYWQSFTQLRGQLSKTSPSPPVRQVAAELAFRSTLVSFCRLYWDLELMDGAELPAGPCFIYGNHSGNYDPFIYNAFTKLGQATAGVMTMEYLESGPIASLFKAVGIQGTRKRVPEPHLIRRIYAMLNAGRRVVIFPEGGSTLGWPTRTMDRINRQALHAGRGTGLSCGDHWIVRGVATLGSLAPLRRIFGRFFPLHRMAIIGVHVPNHSPTTPCLASPLLEH